MPGPLAEPIVAFIDTVAADLEALAGRPMRGECVIEASNLVGALMDADERHTDSELRAWLDDVGSMLEPPVTVTPTRLREGGMLDGKRKWLANASTLFDLLVRADARDGERRSHRYYLAAIKLAHTTAAVDLVPSADELAVLDTFRTKMLVAMDALGVERPGHPRVVAPTPTDPASATATGGGASVDATNAAAATEPPRPIDDVLAELDELVGLAAVKSDVRRLTSLLRIQKIRAERDLPTIETSHHLVFTGNPGTGKTTVARLLSQIYRSLEIVTKGHLVETDRSKLVAGYVGQTAERTRAVLESALGGTLIIDEAYALARGGENDFGREAIDTIVKFMEDHRDDLAIVAAGYPDEMTTLLDANPGLHSRFTRTVHFPDYTTDELVKIFERIGESSSYHVDEEARAGLRALLDATPRTRGFGNARHARNLFEAAVGAQAERLAATAEPSDEQLTTLTARDIGDV
ncbi:MAG: AAA family ATPase [Actinomycetota bacterium]|nr:AAA family ATPase [Actinomycetota bacterium]